VSELEDGLAGAEPFLRVGSSLSNSVRLELEGMPMDPARPAKDGGSDGRAVSPAEALIRAVRERLAEPPAPADAPPELVLGLWIPWDGLSVVALAGEMDIGNASRLREALVAKEPSGPRYLVIELSQLTFMDSLAIHAVTKLAKEATSNNGALVVAGARGHVDRVLDIVKIDELLTRKETLEAALRHVAEMAAEDDNGATSDLWAMLAEATQADG